MKRIVVTSPEALKAIIRDVFSELLETSTAEEQPDNVCLDGAFNLLNELGYPTSKAKIYKLSSTGLIPCRKYGNRLIFSREELSQWAKEQTKPIKETV